MYREAIRSVPWRVRDALVVFVAPWILLPVLAIIALQIAAPSLPLAKQYLDAFSSGDPTASFALVALDAIGSLGLISYYLRKYGAKWRELGIRPFSLLRAAIHIVGVYAIFFILVGVALYVLTLLIPGFNPNETQTNEFTTAAPQFKLLSVLALVILPPLIEEPVFRGFMFPAFAKRFGIVGGAMLSSVLFGLAHLQANVSVYTLVLGLLLCYLYVRLGSIIPGMALHMINNYIAYIALTSGK